MLSPKPLLCFDLDGTLLDSLQDIARCCNDALAQCGYPTHPVAAYKGFVGNGADCLLHRALPQGHSQQDFDQLKAAYMPLYLDCCHQGGTLFDGSIQLLEALKAQGVLLAALTNKPHPHTCACCQVLFGDLLDGWQGDAPGLPLKPDPAGIRAMEQRLGGRCLAMVGDSTVDVQTAHNAGVTAVAVAWGMQPQEQLAAEKPDFLVENFSDLKRFLLDIVSKSI